MLYVSLALLGVCGIASLVCFVMVLVKMFQNQMTGLAVATIVLTLCGPGPLIALVVGWMNADKWGIKNIMVIWTVAILVNMVAYFLVMGQLSTMMPQPTTP